MPMCSAVLHGRCRPGGRADAPQCIGVKTSAWRVRHGREPSRIFSRRGRASNRPVRLRVVLSCRAQKKSSLQGLVGEVLTICRRGWLACWKLAWSQCSGPRLRHLSVCDGPCLIGAWRVSAPSEPTGASRHGQTSSSCPRAATRLIGLEHRDFAVES